MLASSNPDDRISAAEYLTRQGPQAHAALPHLTKLLDGSDLECVAAVRAICAIGAQAESAVPAMVKAGRRQLRDPTESQCWAVIEADVASIGVPAIPRLIPELGADRRTDEVPENMLRALGPQVLPEVAKVLNQGGARAESAAAVIARFAGEGRVALSALALAVRNRKIDEPTFISTVEAIGVADGLALTELRRIAGQAGNPQHRLDAQRVLDKLR
jgi:hypothetical protein